MKVAHQPLHSSIRVNWEFSSNCGFWEGHLILIHLGDEAYYAHWNSNLVIALPNFKTFLRPWAGIGMQKSQYYKLFKGSFKKYVGICVKFEQCDHSYTYVFMVKLGSRWY